jgi:uncharacterized protein
MHIRSCRWMFVVLLLGAAGMSPAANGGTEVGNYRVSDGHLLGVDQFITDNGDTTLLFSDYSSGVVRRLFPLKGGEFVMGPGFNVAAPAELTVRFVRDAQGAITGVSLQYANGTQTVAERVALKEEEVSFEQGDAKLSGTLLMPATTGPSFYPDDLADDALAALRFLRQREDIDSRNIGFWGSSEGGMLATYVASRSSWAHAAWMRCVR